VLDDSQITMLIRRGKDFLTKGDFVTARLLLNRAADAGSAEAALTLGSTFDPFVIQRLGAVAIKPDIDRARKWYQRAAELGSAAASQQLANLARARWRDLMIQPEVSAGWFAAVPLREKIAAREISIRRWKLAPPNALLDRFIVCLAAVVHWDR